MNLNAQLRSVEPYNSEKEQRPFYKAALDFYSNTNVDSLPEGGHDKDLLRTIEEWGPRLWPHGDANIAGTYIAAYANNTHCVDVDNFETEGPLAGIDLQWRAIGLDGNDEGTNGPYLNATGQIHRFAFAPGFGTNNMTFYAATGFGGLWRTENNGDDWEVVNTDNQLPMTSVADVVVDPNDGSTIYIVTGYGDRPSFDLRPISPVNNGATNPLWTAGVFRSMNYGETWECISDGYLSQFQVKAGVARRMIINPNNPNQIFIATSNGVFRTNNAKSSSPYWEQVFIP